MTSTPEQQVRVGIEVNEGSAGVVAARLLWPRYVENSRPRWILIALDRIVHVDRVLKELTEGSGKSSA
jgi:hypothetical protein